MNSQIIEKVKKLLALGQSDNANERDTALAKANALIAEHQIDMVLVQAAPAVEAILEGTVDVGSRRPVESKFLSWLLQSHFRVEVVNNWRWQDGRIVLYQSFIGRKSDVEFASWMYSYLTDEFRRRWSYFKESTVAPASERSTFLYGVYQGLDEKLKAEKSEAEARKFQDMANVGTTVDGIAGQTAEDLRGRYTLAIQDEKAQRKAEMARLYPNLSSGRATRLNLRSSSALSAGRHAGRTISLNRPIAA